VTEYGTQLREKQKLRRVYGMQERQFLKTYHLAVRRKGITGEHLLSLLERRLDNVVYRLGFAASRGQARQLVNHGHFLLNGKKMTIPSVTVNVGDRVFFETDSASLTPTSRSTLDKQAQWLIRYPNHPITIEGHADERGTREYNLALGARRAAATRDYLVSKGVQGNRMRTISYGKERPVAVCNDISCWSQNRRAITVLSAPTG